MRELTIKYLRNFRTNYPFAQLAHRHNSRARQAGVTADLSAEQLEQIWNMYDYRCALTGELNPNVDHVIPIRKGGGSTLTNILPISRSMNSRKRDKCLLIFFDELTEISEERKQAVLDELAARNAMSVEQYKCYLRDPHGQRKGA